LGLDAKADECRRKFGELDDQAREAARKKRLAHSDADRAAEKVAMTCCDIAFVYRRKGYDDKARDLLLRAGLLDPANLVSRTRLAALYMDTGQLREALALGEEIERIDPHGPLGPVLTGRAYASLNQSDRAEQAFRQVIDLAPGRSDGYRELAQLYVRAGRELSEANRLALTAVRLEPSPENLAVLAEVKRRTGDVEGARAAYERALTLDPDNAVVRRAIEELPGRK
jgi:tetratricopeptide (TPR) repeat protein